MMDGALGCELRTNIRASQVSMKERLSGRREKMPMGAIGSSFRGCAGLSSWTCISMLSTVYRFFLLLSLYFVDIVLSIEMNCMRMSCRIGK